MTEEWKDIKGFEGFYQISNLGRVKSLVRKGTPKEIILKQQTNAYGYWQVGLRKPKMQIKFRRPHRLVAEAFIPKVEGKNYINHKNGIKKDNRIENLEWCTFKENSDHAWRTGLIDNRGENMGWAKLTQQQVNEIRSKYIPRKYSMRKLAKEYKVSYGAINAIINNKNWRTI